MTNRISSFVYSNVNDKNATNKKCKVVDKKVGIYPVLMWEYSIRHLQFRDEDPTCCYMFSLGGTCTHMHSAECCEKLSSCFTLFQTKVQALLDTVMMQIDCLENGRQEELKSMVVALPNLICAIFLHCSSIAHQSSISCH